MRREMLLLVCVVVVIGLGSGLKAADVTFSGTSVTEDVFIEDNGGGTWLAYNAVTYTGDFIAAAGWNSM